MGAGVRVYVLLYGVYVFHDDGHVHIHIYVHDDRVHSYIARYDDGDVLCVRDDDYIHKSDVLRVQQSHYFLYI